MRWQKRALCRGAEKRFTKVPARGKSSTTGRPSLTREQRTCLTCPVLEVCLWGAIAEEVRQGDIPTGVRGGLYPIDRMAMGREVGLAEATARYEIEKNWSEES